MGAEQPAAEGSSISPDSLQPYPQAGSDVTSAQTVNRPLTVPFWKRVLDITFVLIATPVLLPILTMTAIIIAVSSKGPLLFTQERIGLLGRKFTLFKFRTMKSGAEINSHEAYVDSIIKSNGPMTKLDAGDSRIIPFGKYLRASGFDELPQLLNVLRGDMSLVGPRPCLQSEYDRYLPWQRERFNTPPGLTGLWQVSGKNRLTFTQMVECDIRYVRTRSLLLDLWILLKTLPAVLAEVRDTLAPPATPPTKQAPPEPPRGER